jgi:hypothetical protein
LGIFCTKHWKGQTSSFFGWGWALTFLYILVALLTNLDVVKIIIWGFVIGFFLILSKYVEAMHHIPLLSPIFTHLRNLHPQFEPGTTSFIGWMLLLLWIATVFHAIACGCKKFTPNQIMELYAFRGSDMMDRAGKHFITRYNDVLESALGIGSGDIIILDDSGKIVKEFSNILFLFFLWPRLEEILEQRVTTVDNSARDAANVKEVNIQAALDARRTAQIAPPVVVRPATTAIAPTTGAGTIV